MIRHLRHTEIDKTWWDEQLLRCENRMWYVQSWVLDLTSPGWEALVDEAEGAMMPLTWRRKFLMKYLFQPYGTQQQGVFAPTYTAALGERYLKALPSEFRYMDIALNEAMHPLEVTGYTTTPLDQQVLPLARSIEALRAGYSKGHKRNLRKAEPATIIDDVTPAEFRDLFVRTTASRYRSGTPADHAMMEKVIAGGLQRNQCTILGIRHDHRLVAAAVFMEWQGRAILYKSAADDKGTTLSGMFQITDAFVARHAGSELLLDFAGSSTPSVARFNSGFGAQRRIYLRLLRNELPLPFKWLKK